MGCGKRESHVPADLCDGKREFGSHDRTVWTYLESHVYDQWDTELQEFFMDISIVKDFTVSLAAMITGNKHVEHMLAQGMEIGNFFVKMGEKDGVWRCKDAMRWSMEQRLHKKRSPEQISRLYYNAGLYYEMEGEIAKALEMYKVYDDTDSIFRLLVANARENAAIGNYYELRNYYLELPEDLIRENHGTYDGNEPVAVDSYECG